MLQKDKKIEKLARLAADGENTIIYAVNLDFLSNEEIEGYEEKRILLFLGYRSETTCSECIKGSCTVPVKRVDYPDGRKMAVYICPDPEHGGRFEIELDKLRYWKINIEVLKAMGYCKKPEKPEKSAGTGGNSPKTIGRPPKYSPEILEAMIKVYEDRYRDKGDSKGAWNTAAKIGGAPSGDAARIACAEYKKKLK